MDLVTRLPRNLEAAVSVGPGPFVHRIVAHEVAADERHRMAQKRSWSFAPEFLQQRLRQFLL